MAFDAGIDYKARQNERKKQMEGVTDPAVLARLQAENDADEVARTEKLASNLSKYGKWASDSELDSAAGLMAERQIGTGFETQKQNLNQSYDQAKQNAQNSALSRGMARSSFIQDREANLDSKRADSLSQIDASKALAIQNAKQNILNNYQTNVDNKLAAEKAEFANTIGAYGDNYMLEIERVRDNNDPSDDWKIPYLQAARQQKIQGNAQLNMQYGDFSGGGSMGLSPEALANAQKMWEYANRNALMPTSGYGGGGYRATGSGGNTGGEDPSKKPLFAGDLPNYGNSAVATVNSAAQQGYSSQQIIAGARQDLAAGKITQKQYNSIVDAAMRRR